MKITSSLMNRAESNALRELERIAGANELRVFAKVRLSDVLEKGRVYLTNRELDYYSRAHCDFVLADMDFRPRMIVEYDGPMHEDRVQKERDKIKNELCGRAGMSILRINDKHVTKRYRGMTVLRWIIEVSQLETWFYEAQESGQIPYDEPFDPCFIGGTDDKLSFPYWLSADAASSLRRFLTQQAPSMPKGWSGVLGSNGEGLCVRLSYLYFGDEIIYVRNAVRKQDLVFPEYDLLSEISTCELGYALERFRCGVQEAVGVEEFRKTFRAFCERYNAIPSYSCGNSPIDASFDFERGWRWKSA